MATPKEEETKPSAEEEKDTQQQLDHHMAELASMKDMLSIKVDGKKSLWTMTMETFGMADGKHKYGDVEVESLEDGLELLNNYILKRKQTEEELINIVPLASFEATMDQFLTSFLKWAEKEDPVTGTNKINVSKALRRLDAYFSWMKENRKDFEEPLTWKSIEEAAKIWDVQISLDEGGKFVWWIDLGSLDKNKIRNLPPRDHIRYVVWFSHLVMFNKNAQDNGAIIIEDMGMIGFWKLATLVPHDISAKMDRLTIGILPIRMSKIYVFGAANWMKLLMGLMKPFMGKKMRERMVILPNKTNIQTFCDDLVSRKNIPKGFSGLEGEYPRDKFLEAYQ